MSASALYGKEILEIFRVSRLLFKDQILVKGMHMITSYIFNNSRQSQAVISDIRGGKFYLLPSEKGEHLKL